MIHSLEERMKKTIAALKTELATVRTGRASVSLLDHVSVDYYGSDMPLNQVATLSVPEPRMIMIAPWEKNMIPVIEKAILSSDLGLNPSNDGAAIRVVLPELTEERRREFVKQVRQYGEKAKVAVRNIRRDANDDVKRQTKDEGISEDDSKRLMEQIQKVTDRYIHDIDQVVEHKEKDLLTV
jgi:ribosome recycling factor